MNLGGLVATDYKEVTSIAALPDVAILLVDYDAKTEVGRHVVWHHIRGSKDQVAFHYVVDPAFWIPEHQRVTTDFRHLSPAWYIEVTASKSGPKGK
jgi:hypothetical protein